MVQPLADIGFWLSKNLLVLVPVFALILWSLLALTGRLEFRRFMAFHRGDGVIRLERGTLYLGEEAAGMGGGAARGVLVLTRKRVGFLRGFPQKEVDLSLACLETAAEGTQFLGRTGPFLSLVVRQGGRRRRYGFQVQDIPGWIEALEGVDGGAIKGGGLPQLDKERLRQEGIDYQ